MSDPVRCPVPGCGKPIKQKKNLQRHIKWYGNYKRDPAHLEYLATKRHRGPLPPREPHSEAYMGARGPGQPPAPGSNTGPSPAPPAMMTQLPPPPKPVPREGGAPPDTASKGAAPIAEKAELASLSFGTAPPARYEALPGATYSTQGVQPGVWDDTPAPGFETALEFAFKLTASFASGEIKDFGKPKKEDYVAFAKYLRNRKGQDLDPMVVALVTGSRIIVGMIVNIILGFMKMIEKWKEKAATRKAESEAKALADKAVAEDAAKGNATGT